MPAAKKKAAKKAAKAPAKRGRGRPRAAESSRAAPASTPTSARRLEIEAELDRLTGQDDVTMATQVRIAVLQVARWTILSRDPALNFREQGEASREAARWQLNHERCASALAVDQIAVLMERMTAQESAADRLDKLR